MQTTKKIGSELRTKTMAIALNVCSMISLLGTAQTVAAQLPQSRPKPGSGGVVKLHGQPYLFVNLPAGASYQLSPVCTNPILTFTVRVTNQGTIGNRAQPADTVVAVDDSLFPERWQGQASLPEIPPGQSVTVKIPIAPYATPAANSGSHIFRLYVLGVDGKDPTTQAVHTASVRVSIPDGFCVPPSNKVQEPKSRPSTAPPNKRPSPRSAVTQELVAEPAFKKALGIVSEIKDAVKTALKSDAAVHLDFVIAGNLLDSGPLGPMVLVHCQRAQLVATVQGVANAEVLGQPIAQGTKVIARYTKTIGPTTGPCGTENGGSSGP